MAESNVAPEQPQAHGYPAPVKHEAAYQPARNPQNPPLKGTPLVASSFLVTHSNTIAKFFYGNLKWSEEFEAIKDLDQCIPTYVTNVVPNPATASAIASSQPVVFNEADYRKKVVSPETSKTKRFHTVLDYVDAYKTGKTTPTAVVEALLPLIRRDVSNATSHSVAFISCKSDFVLKAAREATERWKAGKPLGVLDGVPIAMKDDIDLKDYPRTMGLRVPLEESRETSWCIQKLEEQGAVILGKCNMHQIGMDTTNNNPHQGTPLNPYNDGYYTGGSSGGCAYAVASGLVPFAQGSDAGGSIRVPCCFCGIYGLKPTHNRVSIRPTLSGAPSTAVFGPLAATMADLEVAFRLMATPDAADLMSKLYRAPARPTRRNKVLGVYRQWFDESDKPVKDLCNKAIRWLKAVKEYEVVDINIPYVHTGQAAHSLTTMAEIGSLIGDKQSKKQLAHPNRILVAIGSQAPAKDFFAAQKLRTLINEHLSYLWKQHPGMIIVTPTVPFAGWKIEKGELKRGMSNGNKTIKSMKYIWLANFCGLPSLQAPVGYEKEASKLPIPVGLTGNGEWGSDEELIEFGFDLEEFLDSEEGGRRTMPPNFVDVLDDLIGRNQDQEVNNIATIEKQTEPEQVQQSLMEPGQTEQSPVQQPLTEPGLVGQEQATQKTAEEQEAEQKEAEKKEQEKEEKRQSDVDQVMDAMKRSSMVM